MSKHYTLSQAERREFAEARAEREPKRTMDWYRPKEIETVGGKSERTPIGRKETWGEVHGGPIK
jgi:hypothetical protein